MWSNKIHEEKNEFKIQIIIISNLKKKGNRLKEIILIKHWRQDNFIFQITFAFFKEFTNFFRNTAKVNWKNSYVPILHNKSRHKWQYSKRIYYDWNHFLIDNPQFYVRCENWIVHSFRFDSDLILFGKKITKSFYFQKRES